jgi:formylglycine-generating enzyme required for sulfatase activity
MKMLNKLTNYAWMILLVLIAYPYNTTFAQSDTPTAGQIWKETITGMEFVWVPGGCYEMGCGSWTSDCYRDEKPVHEVCVDGFWMGKTEVTQGQWKQVMGDNPAEFQKGDNYPIEKVTWSDVNKFIEKLSLLTKGAYGFYLPTEAEWEYACRSGGKPEKYAGGKDLHQLAWCNGNSDLSTHAVGTKAPNGLGLFDMNGNVYEWCADTYRGWSYSKHERNNPVFKDGESVTGVYRGGSWKSKPKEARCSARSYAVQLPRNVKFGCPDNPHQSGDTGFRLVKKK